ncbi:MAG: antitoxin VapB [Candidatus Eremiobacteraeota bacterium]|jgi:antitoxin VapB|nr:antitoxin VapB [Candidatus Eremiobacteraeota bacterium]
MTEYHLAKLFRNGGSQAVRLPAEFRFEGDQVRIRRQGKGVLIEPVTADTSELFALLDQLVSDDFMSDRAQPLTPVRDIFS